jgi:hypothetical protein
METFKSRDVCFVTIVLCMFLIQTLEEEKGFITYYKTYGIKTLKKKWWMEIML